MKWYETIRLSIKIIPDEIIEQYNLQDMEKYRYVYAEIRKVICGFPQATRISNDLLTKNIAPRGYCQFRHTPGLGKHKWWTVAFSLVADGCGVKFVGIQHYEHLIDCIKDIIQSWLTGLVASTVGLRWNGITSNSTSCCICQDMSLPHDMNINTQFPSTPSMHHKIRND